VPPITNTRSFLAIEQFLWYAAEHSKLGGGAPIERESARVADASLQNRTILWQDSLNSSERAIHEQFNIL
jgi:hypothetical protein